FPDSRSTKGRTMCAPSLCAKSSVVGTGRGRSRVFRNVLRQAQDERKLRIVTRGGTKGLCYASTAHAPTRARRLARKDSPMPQFRTTIVQSGKTATGIEVPPEVVEALGAGKRPPVTV